MAPYFVVAVTCPHDFLNDGGDLDNVACRDIFRLPSAGYKLLNARADGGKALSVGAIVAPTILGVLLLCIFAFFGYRFLKRRRATSPQAMTETTKYGVSPFTWRTNSTTVDPFAEAEKEARDPYTRSIRTWISSRRLPSITEEQTELPRAALVGRRVRAEQDVSRLGRVGSEARRNETGSVVTPYRGVDADPFEFIDRERRSRREEMRTALTPTGDHPSDAGEAGSSSPAVPTTTHRPTQAGRARFQVTNRAFSGFNNAVALGQLLIANSRPPSYTADTHSPSENASAVAPFPSDTPATTDIPRQTQTSAQDVQAVPGPSSKPMTIEGLGLISSLPSRSRRRSLLPFSPRKRSSSEPRRISKGSIGTPVGPIVHHGHSSSSSFVSAAAIPLPQSPSGSDVPLALPTRRRNSASSDSSVPTIPPLPFDTGLTFDIGSLDGFSFSAIAEDEESSAGGSSLYDAHSARVLLPHPTDRPLAADVPSTPTISESGKSDQSRRVRRKPVPGGSTSDADLMEGSSKHSSS